MRVLRQLYEQSERASRLAVLAALIYMVITATTVALLLKFDRETVLAATRSQAQGIARMIMAHGEAAIASAESIAQAIQADVRGWDLRDPVRGRRLHEVLRDLVVINPHIASGWVLDPEGDVRLDSWTHPPAPLSAEGRPYFDRHLRGDPGPVILGDSEPDPVTGHTRFTYSLAIRRADGELHGIVAIGILSEPLDTIYREAATWDGARAGLYSTSGDFLARLKGQPRASPEFIAAIEGHMAEAPRASAVITSGDGERLAAWHRSERYPSLYATASRPVASALAQWRVHAVTVVVLSLAGMGALGGLLWMTGVASAAREQAAARDLALREIDHRVKNSLQLAASLINLKGRRSPNAKAEIDEIRKQIMAIAEVHAVLQDASGQEGVELGDLLRRLAAGWRGSSPTKVVVKQGPCVEIPAGKANAVAVIVNELATNAMKYGRTEVILSWEVVGERVAIAVEDDGPGFPPGFDAGKTARFGLHAMQLMAVRMDGDVEFGKGARDGALVRLVFPFRPASV